MEIIKDVVRFDRGLIKKAVITDEGYLQCDAVCVARAGCLDYEVRPDGTPGLRTDFVSIDELKKSTASLKMLPMTNGHPKDLPKGFIDATTAKQHQVGYVGETVNAEDSLLLSNLKITDAKAVQDYKNGKRGLSLAYKVELIPTPGVFNGKQYDYIQINRQYNHLALCDIGRAGEMARIPDLVNHDGYEIENEHQPQKRSYVMTVSINIDGIDYKDQAPEVANRLGKVAADLAAANEKIKTLTANTDSISGQLDALKSENVKLKEDAKTLPEKIAAGIKGRVALESQCLNLLDEADKKNIGSFSDIDIRKKVAVKAFPKLADKINAGSAEYVLPVFDSAIEVLSASNFDDAIAEQRKMANGGKHPSASNADDIPITVDEARNKMIAKVSNLYKAETTK